MMMMTEMDIETSVYNVHLTRLIAREDFINFLFLFIDITVRSQKSFSLTFI
jgi:hypothetical protein